MYRKIETKFSSPLCKKLAEIAGSKVSKMSITIVYSNAVVVKEPTFTVIGKPIEVVEKLTELMEQSCQHILFELHENQCYFNTSFPSLFIKLTNLHTDSDILGESLIN